MDMQAEIRLLVKLTTAGPPTGYVSVVHSEYLAPLAFFKQKHVHLKNRIEVELWEVGRLDEGPVTIAVSAASIGDVTS